MKIFLILFMTALKMISRKITPTSLMFKTTTMVTPPKSIWCQEDLLLELRTSIHLNLLIKYLELELPGKECNSICMLDLSIPLTGKGMIWKCILFITQIKNLMMELLNSMEISWHLQWVSFSLLKNTLQSCHLQSSKLSIISLTL
jgi:hypothetical protein